MTRSERRAARDVLWQVMVAAAEALNDATVFEQGKMLSASARRIRRLALEVTSLAEAILLLTEGACR